MICIISSFLVKTVFSVVVMEINDKAFSFPHKCGIVELPVSAGQPERMHTMKKYMMLMLALCLLLGGCGKESGQTTVPTEQPTLPPTETTVQPTTMPTQVTEPTAIDVNPLTGEELDEKNDSRLYAIMLNNHSICLPHLGVGAADVIYETCVEGGMTRFMAIFSDPAKAGPIGAVRSARPPYVDIVKGYDAIYASASGAPNVLDMIWENGVDYLNGLTTSYFYRDDWRIENMGYEHSLLVNGEDLVNFAKDEGMRLTRKEDANYGFTFDESVPFGGEPAGQITLEFQSGGKETELFYEKELGGYKLVQYDMDYVDGNTDKLVPFRNVLILNANRWILSNGVHVQMDTVGEGTGYYARDGKLIPIKWSRADVDSPFVYTTEDGKPLSFGVGKTYVAIIQDGAPVEYHD